MHLRNRRCGRRRRDDRFRGLRLRRLRVRRCRRYGRQWRRLRHRASAPPSPDGDSLRLRKRALSGTASATSRVRRARNNAGDSCPLASALCSSIPSSALCSEIDTLASAVPPSPASRCKLGNASAIHIAHAPVPPTSCTTVASARRRRRRGAAGSDRFRCVRSITWSARRGDRQSIDGQRAVPLPR
jgi:hypothetical protein